MADDKIVLATFPADQGDIIHDYIEWNFALGVDQILAEDINSTDNTHEVLNHFSKSGQLHWFPTPVKNYLNRQPAELMAKQAREEYGADWLIMCDVDEFLCTQGADLRTILKRAAEDDVTAIRIPSFNMTGVPMPGKRATQTHTLRVDRAVMATPEQKASDAIPVPYIFLRHPPKTIVRMSAFTGYGAGSHVVTVGHGKTIESSDLRLLHFPIREFHKFQKKVENVTAFFEANTHFEDWWAWHWRRWIRMNQAGRLQEEYERQFVSAARVEELIREGTCSIDSTIADWIHKKEQLVAV